LEFRVVRKEEERVMSSVPRRVRVEGPLAGFAEGFAADLTGRLGYSPLTAVNHLYVMAHLSRWLGEQGLVPAELSAGRAEDFAACRRAAGYTSFVSVRGLAPLLGYLRGLGVVPAAGGTGPVTAVQALAEGYRSYLAGERGLSAGRVEGYVREACLFLAGRAERVGELTAAEVTQFVVAGCGCRGPGAAKNMVTALRSLLRYLYLSGAVAVRLDGAVPAVAGCRDAGLPKALPAGQVAALLASCDRGRPAGRRDFAVLTLLARLGLRAGEVAALELGDIGWRGGELLVRGKGRREERLPLTADAGEAIAGYLRDGRPPGGSRNVFLRACAPYDALSAGGVKSVVRRACDRAGFPRAGAHRLRHSAATGMLRAGASLEEVGQVLRHRAAATTAIYAKVDDSALSILARPWPVAR
jgi:integrase/recombinase XerD